MLLVSLTALTVNSGAATEQWKRTPGHYLAADMIAQSRGVQRRLGSSPDWTDTVRPLSRSGTFLLTDPLQLTFQTHKCHSAGSPACKPKAWQQALANPRPTVAGGRPCCVA